MGRGAVYGVPRQVDSQQEVCAMANMYDQILFCKQVRIPREWPYVFVRWRSTAEVSFLPYHCVHVPMDFIGMAEADGPLCFWSRHFQNDNSEARATSQGNWEAAGGPPIPPELLLNMFDNPGTPIQIPVGARVLRPPPPPVYTPEEERSGRLLAAHGIGGLASTATGEIITDPVAITAKWVGGGHSVTFPDHASWVDAHPTAELPGTRYVYGKQLWVATAM